MDKQIVPQNKKLFYGAIAVVCVVVIFIFITILTAGSTKQSIAPTTTTSKDSTSGSTQQNQDATNPNSVNQATQMNTYKNSYFSFNYPLDWKAEEIKLTNSGIEVRVRPIKANDPSAQNMLIIQESISSVPSIKQKQLAFVNQGFNSTSTPVDSLLANRLTGTFPSNRTASQSARQSALQMNHIYLDKGNYSYLFDYSYISKGVSPQIENVFSKIINSFKFAQ